MTSVAGTQKFQALVEDFARTAADLGCAVVPGVAAAELEARISAVAAQLHISERTALRTYFDDDWGRQMASDLCRQLAEREALVDAEHGRELPVGGVARLVAGLGQALLYFSVNEASVDQPPGGFSVKDASEAVTGLGLALADCSPGGVTIHVDGNIIVWAREALQVFSGNLEQQDIDAAVLRAVRLDQRYLGEWTAEGSAPLS